MSHLPNGRQSTPHLRLCPAEVKALWEQGHYTPKGYLYQLVLAHRKPGWPWKISNISEFCREWGFARRTFYKAKAALISEGLLEEEITGSFTLIANSTNVCAPLDTPVPGGAHPVPGGAHPVPGGAHPVPGGAHSSSKTLDIQGICSSTTLNTFKTTNTPLIQRVCVEKFPKNSEVQTEVSDCDRQPIQVKNASDPSEATVTSKDKFPPPILLQTEKIGVNVHDRALQRVVETWPDRVPTAITCLEEKQLTVKHPTRFLQRAIEEDWKPETTQVTPLGFKEWFDEARRRSLVIASQRQNDTIMICTADERWVPFEQLQRLSWDELRSRVNTVGADAVEGQAAPRLQE